MKTKRIVIATAAVAAVAAGSAGAIAATQDDGTKTEQAVLDSAAKKLNVSPTDLRDALGSAEDAQIDQAVKDGKLTQQQADAMKARRKQDGRVLGIGRHGGPGDGHGPGGGPGALLDPAAKALGLTTPELMTQLRAGKSLADVAKAQNKDLADVKAAVKKAATISSMRPSRRASSPTRSASRSSPSSTSTSAASATRAAGLGARAAPGTAASTDLTAPGPAARASPDGSLTRSG